MGSRAARKGWIIAKDSIIVSSHLVHERRPLAGAFSRLSFQERERFLEVAR